MGNSLKVQLAGMTVALAVWTVVGCSQVTQSPPRPLDSSPSSPLTTPAFPSKAEREAAAKLRQLGLQYRTSGRYPEAIQSLEQAAALDPQNLSGRVTLGWTLHLAGREAAALKTLQQVLEKDANHIPALNALGIVYLTRGNLQAAVATHQRAIQLDSRNEVAYYNLTLAYHRLGEYDLAIVQGREATVLEPGNPHPWVALALVYWDKGEKRKARQTYNQAVQLDVRYGQAEFLSELKLAGFTPQQVQVARQILNSQ